MPSGVYFDKIREARGLLFFQKKTFPWNRGFYRNMPLRAKLSMRSGVKGGGWRWTVLFSPLNLVSSGFYRRCAMAATSSAEPTKRHALFGVGGNPRGLVIGFPPCRVESVGFPLYFWAPKACRFVGSRFPAPAIREALLGGVVFQDSGCFPPLYVGVLFSERPDTKGEFRGFPENFSFSDPLLHGWRRKP